MSASNPLHGAFAAREFAPLWKALPDPLRAASVAAVQLVQQADDLFFDVIRDEPEAASKAFAVLNAQLREARAVIDPVKVDFAGACRECLCSYSTNLKAA